MVNHAGPYDNVNVASYDNGLPDDDYGGPILQPIPDYLMVNDYIEISGVCRGQDVIVELLADPQRNSQDPEVLPLHIGISAGGPVLVWSQSREKIERQEHNVRMGLQLNAAFELCIYAMEDGFEIKLNKEMVCRHKYLISLEDIVAISMDGDADFTSIEFKDIYGEENEVTSEAAPHPPGLMRVQSFRTSGSRKPSSPQLVRSSTRRSGRMNAVQSPTTMQFSTSTIKQEWRTSSDLSRPVLDVDPPRGSTQMSYQESGVEFRSSYAPNDRTDSMIGTTSPSRNRLHLKSGARKSFTLEDSKLERQSLVGGSQSHVVAGDAHQGSYQLVDDERKLAYRPNSMYPAGYGTLNGSTASIQAKSRKHRISSIFSRSRKSKGSESDISSRGTEKDSKRKGIKGLFKHRKSGENASTTELRSASSLPDFSRRASNDYVGDSGSLLMLPALYLGAGPDMSPVRGPVPKSKLKQSASEIAAYVAGQKAVPEFENFHLSDRTHLELPKSSYTTPVAIDNALREAPSPGPSVSGQRKLKGTAPELADILIDTGRAGFKQNTTLTTSWHQLSWTPSGHADEPIVIGKERKLQLKGPAPEIANSIEDQYGNRYSKDTTLINIKTADTLSISHASTPSVGTETHKYVDLDKPGKLKGTAAEITARLHDTAIHNQRHVPETTLTMMSSKEKSTVVSDKPMLDVQLVYSQPDLMKPQYQEPPIYLARPASLDRSAPVHYDSGGSTVHSDDEHYLEVGRSAYYLERKQSLARWTETRSRASRHFGSPSSSISSLKQEELDLIMRSGPKRSVARLDQVHSWLNSGYANESPIYPMAANRPVVYAACPNAQSFTKTDLIIKSEELRKERFGARFPLALQHGRAATITGHFLLADANETSHCRIHLTSSETAVDAGSVVIVLQVWSNGSLKVVGHRHNEAFTMTEWVSQTSVGKEQFSITIHARSLYNAFTINDMVTLISQMPFNLSDLTYLQLEDWTYAELDTFSVSNNLLLPIRLAFPNGPLDENTQNFRMSTKLTADSEQVILNMFTRTNRCFKLILDFVQDCMYLQPVTEGAIECKEAIPFVPEQVKKICVQLKKSDGKLTAIVNHEEIFSRVLQLPELVTGLSQVQVDGDLMLLEATFE